MKNRYALTLAVVASAAIGFAFGNGLHAQGKPPSAYAVIDISEITNPDDYKTIAPKAAASLAAAEYGARTLVRGENFTAVDGTPPKRMVIIAFDSMDKARGWIASASQKELSGIRLRSTKSREFLVEGLAN
jgi:uncharacterized protein (DUF1330 family)